MKGSKWKLKWICCECKDGSPCELIINTPVEVDRPTRCPITAAGIKAIWRFDKRLEKEQFLQ